MIAKIAAWVGDLVGRAVSGIADFVNSIVNGIKDLPSKFVSIGGQIIRGFWNGIHDKFSWLMDMIGGFFGRVKSKIKSFFGIKSPSRWGEKDIGNNLIYGIANGITRKTAYALGVVSDFTSSIKDRFASDMQGVEADLTVNGGYNGSRLKRDAITLPPGARYNQISRNGVGVGETTVMQTININQPVETPGEHARVLRSEAVKFGLAGAI